MIVKGSEDPKNLNRCLSTIAPFVDGIFITITTPDESGLIKELCSMYGAFYEELPYKFHREVQQSEFDWLKDSFGYEPTLKVGDKIFQFDKARNYNLEQVGEEYEWMVWLDADDIFRGGQFIRELIKQAEANKAESVFLNYIYQCTTKNGAIDRIIIEHTRERFVKNNGAYKWVAPIHETLIEQRPTTKIETKDCDVVHLSSGERMLAAIERNMKTLELSIFDAKARDPRPIYYLGKAYFDLKGTENLERALGLFKIYLNGSPEYENNNKSGWAEERSQCWEYVAEIYRMLGRIDMSIRACHNAMIEDCKFPSIYLSLALSYAMKNEWDNALFWLKKSLETPSPHTTLVSNPRDVQARALEVTYHASLGLNKLDDAFEAAKKLMELDPTSAEMKGRVELTTNLMNQRELTKMVMAIANYLDQTGEKDKLRPLLTAAPSIISNNPFMIDLHRKIYPPRTWADNEVAIMCGPGFTNWSPKLLENPNNSFMGGSEEAVVYLSKELSKLGWKVTVYADPGLDEGEYNGVNYVPYYKFNALDDFNILVSWRNPRMADNNYKCKKLYIWCHDIQSGLDYTPERLAKITKVIVLSPWHRENISNVPDDKIMVSGNGITL